MSDIYQILNEALTPEKPPKCKCVVRLTTSQWHNADGLHLKRSLTYLKRKCVGFNFLDEDADMTGTDLVFARITNLNKCEDGIYQVVTCNEWSSWETPHIIEDYDYKLVPI